MAAASSSSTSCQAVSLLGSLCVLSSPSLSERTRLGRQLCVHDRFFFKWSLWTQQLHLRPHQARPLALSSVGSSLPEVHHGLSGKPKAPRRHPKAAPECDNQSESEKSVKLESDTVRRKGRKKKGTNALPHEHEEPSNENGSIATRDKICQASQGSLLLVRSVVNAEDSSSEGSNHLMSDGFANVAHLDASEEKIKENPGGVRRRGSKGSKIKSGGMLLEVKTGGLTKSVAFEGTDSVDNTSEVQARSSQNNAASEVYTSNETATVDDIDAVVIVDSRSSPETQKWSTSESSTSGRQKPQRRWKFEGELLEQEQGQTIQVTELSGIASASEKHDSEEQFSGDQSDNKEYPSLEPHMDIETDAVVKPEYDIKIGGNVVDVTEYVGILPISPAPVSVVVESTNVGRQKSRRRKKSKSECFKQNESQKVEKTESFSTASMSGGHAVISIVLSDEKLPKNQSDIDKCDLLESHMNVENGEGKVPKHDDWVQGTILEASDAGEGLGAAMNFNATNMEGRDTRHQTDMEDTFVVGDTDSESSQQREEMKSRLPRNSRRSKRLRKQKLAEEAKLAKAQGEASDVSERDQGMCPVRWLVEAHLNTNQKLFLVGASSHLGAWDPTMAVGFLVCEESGQPNMWQAQSQVPLGTHSEYNYFIQVGDERTNHIVWRPGPRLHLAIPPLKDSPYKEVTVRDSLDFNVANKLPALLWGGLRSEIGFPTELIRFLGDQPVSEESQNQVKLFDMEQGVGSSVPKQEGKPDVSVQDLEGEQGKDCQHRVEVDGVHSDASSKHTEGATLLTKSQAEEHLTPVRLSPKLKKYIRKRVFPREEPWLMESMILYDKGDSSKTAAVSLAETDREAEDSQPVVEKAPESPLPTVEKGEISTEILISSSKCTMERIAILEDGKLVELLLKPVNSDINVGNVYLGIVKKLLPGMTGVFVDIGHPRVALLTITKNMYPFTFPPIIAPENPSNGHVADSDGHAVGQQGDVSTEHGQSYEKSDHPLDEDWEIGDEDGEEDEESEVIDDVEEFAYTDTNLDASYEDDLSEKKRGRKLLQVNGNVTRPITVNFGQRFTKWRKVEEGMRIIVQVKREPLGKKGPKVCAFPQLSSRFWVLGMGGKSTGVSKKIYGPERKRLKDLANLFRKPGLDLTVRTEAAGQSPEDLEKDMMRLLETWKDIMEQAEAASMAAQNGQDGAVPALLHRAMGQTLSIVRDFFAEKVHRMVVDSAQTYHEVTSYLQEVAPQLLNRVELYTGTMPIFDVFNLEAEIDRLLNERVQLPNGAYLVIEETEALVSIDVNGGAGMLGKSMKSAAILEANLAAARQIAVELRLRDIGGIIVIDFIDMDEDEHESLVYEEMRNAIQLDRSIIHISEISELGLMELTRRRVRPSVTFMISDPCSCCRGTGRVEALETTFSKIERAILRLVANHSESIHFDGRTWKKVLLRVDPVMFEFLTRKQRAAQLSSSLKVYIILKVGREMTRGSFELNELNLGSEKRSLASGQQHRSLSRKSVHLGSVGRKDFASRT